MQTRLPALSSPSFALISVLALVSLAALTATAFLASARLERQATRPLGETARLEMACASAKECASQTLNLISEPRWHTIATYWRGTNTNDWTNELGYLLLGRPNSVDNVRWTYYCGFNTALHKKLDTNVFLTRMTNTNPWLFLAEIGGNMATMTNGFVTNPTSTDTNCTLIPLLGGRTSPPVGWTYIYQAKKIANSTNTTNVPVARFSYYMEDLSGLIDAERMGGSARTTGTNASEISLTNLFTNWSSNSIINATNYDQFINPTNRSKYFSPALMLYANTNISTNDLRYFAHGLLSWSNFPNTIPVGVPITQNKGYSQGNKLKLNLNSAPNSTVDTIATAINANLPAFTNRAGGMAGGTYVSNIAANIVDYVDTDGSPTTTGTYGTTNYSQGVDSYPWVNEVATRVTVQSYTASSSNLVLNMRGFAELWNLSDKPFTGDISLTMQEDDFIQAESATAITAPNTPLQTSGTLTTNITILPMQFKVVEVFSNLVTLTVPEPSGTGTKYVTWPTASTNSTFELKISGVTVQKPLGGLARRVDTSKTLTGNSDCLDLTTPALMEKGANSRKIYRGNPLTHANLASFDFMNEGDPRMTPFRIIGASTNHTWATYEIGASYFMGNGRSSFGGWNTNASLTKLSLTNFLEPSHSLTPGNRPTGPVNANGIFAVLPTEVVPIAPEPTKALQKLNNTGTFSNICELGNIFDPVQWSFSSTAVKPGGSIPANAVPTGPATRRGGGNTLRIGRAEHPLFAFTKLGGGAYPVPNMGRSAAALLDLFSTSDSYDNGGRINLNTAPAPVLRALAGGVTLTNDVAMTPSSTLAIPNRMTEAFAQGVMRYRSIYPFLSPSQLAFIATDYGITNPTTSHWTNTWPKNAVFGNTNPTIFLDINAPGNDPSWATASNGVTAWNDQAAEEWFSKIYNLSTVQSWNYRTYVVAQLVNTNGLPTGPTMRKYSLMYIRYNGSFSAGISAGPFVSFESPY